MLIIYPDFERSLLSDLVMEKTQDQQAGSMLALLLRATFQLVMSFVTWGGLLFLSAGSIAWLRGWLHIWLWVVTFAINAVVLLMLNRDVLSARLEFKWSSERADTVLLMLFLLVTLAVPVVAGLDAVRYGWTLVPFWTVYLGIPLHAAGDALLLWTMVVNPFLEKVVRVQTERGHYVITTGPYAIVRHPMYLGVILMFLAVPLVLGSAWTFAPVTAMTLLLMVRTVLEERLLCRDLPGYEEYMSKTRWRIVPGLW
jgi:protein-S-isoprenylcysteine O-methyltransferase Ste14